MIPLAVVALVFFVLNVVVAWMGPRKGSEEERAERRAAAMVGERDDA